MRILAVTVFSVVPGLLVGAAAGTVPGIAVFTAAAAAGASGVVLARRQRDRSELERAMVRIPVQRIAGYEPPARERR